MKVGRVVVLALVLGVVGLVVGYFIFARRPVLDGWYPVEWLLRTPESGARETIRDLAGITAARQNTLIAGGAGIVLGVVIGLTTGRR